MTRVVLRISLVFTVLLIGHSLHCSASPTVDPPLLPTQAKTRVGDVATIQGRVTQVRISRHGDVFLHFGGCHPNVVFTAIIPSDRRKDFSRGNPFAGTSKAEQEARGIGNDPQQLKSEVVLVHGLVERHQGRLRMILRKPGELFKQSGRTTSGTKVETTTIHVKRRRR